MNTCVMTGNDNIASVKYKTNQEVFVMLTEGNAKEVGLNQAKMNIISETLSSWVEPLVMKKTFYIVPDDVVSNIVRRKDSDPRGEWLNNSEFLNIVPRCVVPLGKDFSGNNGFG